MPVVAFVLWLIVAGVFLKLPDHKYHQSKLKPVIHARYTSILQSGVYQRIAHIACGCHKVDRRMRLPHSLVLWVVPLFTAFAFFMILRQLVQHGNGGARVDQQHADVSCCAVHPLRGVPVRSGLSFAAPYVCDRPALSLEEAARGVNGVSGVSRGTSFEVHGYFVSPEKAAGSPDGGRRAWPGIRTPQR